MAEAHGWSYSRQGIGCDGREDTATMKSNEWPDDSPAWLVYGCEALTWVIPFGMVGLAVLLLIGASVNYFAYTTPKPYHNTGLDNWLPVFVGPLLALGSMGIWFRLGGRS